jgi:glycosyltransferase involved in cell wall biosynthesis
VTAPAAVERARVRSEMREAIGCPIDRVVIVCTARMEHWKGQLLLIEALSLLRGDRWEAWIGGGAQRPEEEVYLASLHRQVDAARIRSKVKFIGQRSDVPRVLAAADIHCQPNLGPEPFGIAFIEALFAALPVVTTRLGAPADFIEESCGRLVEPNNAPALAAVLQSLIDDSVERERLGQGGPPRANALCNVDRQLQQLHDVIRNQLGGIDRSAEIV